MAYNKQLEQTVRDNQLATPGQILGFFGEYKWLSNFHLCPVTYEGVVYPSSENAFQAAKFYKMTPEDVDEWNKRRSPVMLRILCNKFEKNRDLRDKIVGLFSKGTMTYLEETNWWNDTYWGVCDGKGQNELGSLLTATAMALLIDDGLKVHETKNNGNT
jgi:predicted NAD-dependent protein-ADP-ribosyltransferase YbiA (DUF1768 family)